MTLVEEAPVVYLDPEEETSTSSGDGKTCELMEMDLLGNETGLCGKPATYLVEGICVGHDHYRKSYFCTMHAADFVNGSFGAYCGRCNQNPGSHKCRIKLLNASLL